MFVMLHAKMWHDKLNCVGGHLNPQGCALHYAALIVLYMALYLFCAVGVFTIWSKGVPIGPLQHPSPLTFTHSHLPICAI